MKNRYIALVALGGLLLMSCSGDDSASVDTAAPEVTEPEITEPDDLAVASDLFERWMTGWNDNDPDALADLFTEVGTVTFEGRFETEVNGREEIRAMLAGSVGAVSDVESTGPVTMVDDGTFTCSDKYRIGDQDYVSDIVLEVEDGLISSLSSSHEYAEDGD